jgi:HAD superfamily hydrolase (TIGR01509 family)
MSRIQAVILDLDGLMVDSEHLSHKAWQVFLGKFGYSLDGDEYSKVIGIEGDAAVDHLRQSMDLPLSNEEIIDHHYELWMEIANDETRPMQGLLEVVHALKARGLKMGVASNSYAEYVGNMLKKIGLDSEMQCVYTADMVEMGKPAPDVYLATADCLGVAPEVCLAMEDSPTGLQSALNAGMRCAVVPNRALVDVSYDGAFAIFPTLLELTKNLDWLLS